MSAQPKRKPEPHAAPVEVPRLRRRADLRAVTEADRPHGGAGEVSKLQAQLAAAFAGRPARGVDIVLKVLIGAASCLFIGAAVLRDGPLLAQLLG